MLGLRRLPPERFAHGFDQLALLLTLNLLVWAGLDTLHAEPRAQLALDGLYGWAFYLLLGLFACGVVARAYCRQADTRSLLIPLLSVSPYVLTVFWFADDLPYIAERPLRAIFAAIVYLLVLGIRVMQAAYSEVRRKAAIVACVFIMASPFVFLALNIDTRLWLTDDVDNTPPDDAGGTESLLYDQPAHIVASVEHMSPRDPDAANVFYVGFGGDGEQSVFKRETLFAETVFDQHFGSGDHSLDLINDNDDRDSYPIATVSGLRQALKLVASRMDINQDVLVLMLTSHGSQDGLAVVNGGMPLLQLTPGELEHALDESGIKWRVIIVSACYAGVFLDSLKSDNTLVITASDADHSSFGCDDDRDLTYFGEAFLKDSVPTTRTLEQAFAKTVDLIAQRETAEHKTPSNPQMAAGDGIRAKLAELEGTARPPQNSTVVQNRPGP